MKIRCAVIDDERLAREYLKNYINKVPELEFVGEFNSPLKAMSLINSNGVDLLFLDIQMPDITGVDFLKSLKVSPYVIFTTAYHDYAIEGFNLDVVDYLLKPFPFDRFYQAVGKVIKRFCLHDKTDISENNAKELQNGLSVNQSEAKILDNYLTIRADRKFYKVNYEDIIFIEGQKAYVTFHTSFRNITALASMKDLESQLPSEMFIRIHKSYIVSIKNISAMEGNILELGDVRLPIGSTYRNAVGKIFED